MLENFTKLSVGILKGASHTLVTEIALPRSVSPGTFEVTLAYKFRRGRSDSWNVSMPWGTFPVDIRGLEMFAAYGGQSVSEYAEAHGIDLSKPEIPAVTGFGSAFYAELSAHGEVADALTLGDGEDLGSADDAPLGFYGKVTLRLYSPKAADSAVLKLYAPPDCGYDADVYYTAPTFTETDAPETYVGSTPAFAPAPEITEDYAAIPCDRDAVPCAKKLLAYLKGVADAGYLLYGVQNYPYEKGGGGYAGADAKSSDVYDLVGANPAIFGLDSLSLIGMENAWRVEQLPDGDYVRGSALRSIVEWRGGSISTLSMHMSDPAMVYDDYINGNRNRATGEPLFENGKWNFKGYGYDNSCRTATDSRDGRERSPHKPMLRIYRGDEGVIGVFNAYLDLVAEYCLLLQAENVPVLLRPFHENSGDWFWWGNSGCEDESGAYAPEIFRANWRYIVEYLQGKGVHNALYVYSPNGDDFDNETKLGTAAFRPYKITYPGDEFVDITAFDDYTTDRAVLKSDVKTVTDFAHAHNKVAAASEVTGSPTDGAISAFLFGTLSDTAEYKQHLAYMLQWTPPSYAPYLVSPTRANSGAVREFVGAVTAERILLSNRTKL
ncbi:MAG: glycoside hydrolase family 26 protein [Oscillospiraceae bacterium]|jgi:mannan endo-1,4-beta-mannosidase|nr:glycoside hydrolase family 26 protein [Oscillospiraceae bacterium]